MPRSQRLLREKMVKLAKIMASFMSGSILFPLFRVWILCSWCWSWPQLWSWAWSRSQSCSWPWYFGHISHIHQLLTCIMGALSITHLYLYLHVYLYLCICSLESLQELQAGRPLQRSFVFTFPHVFVFVFQNVFLDVFLLTWIMAGLTGRAPFPALILKLDPERLVIPAHTRGVPVLYH